jgi:hypothetical protein
MKSVYSVMALEGLSFSVTVVLIIKLSKDKKSLSSIFSMLSKNRETNGLAGVSSHFNCTSSAECQGH